MYSGSLVEMLTKCHQSVATFQVCHYVSWHDKQHQRICICGVYQRITQWKSSGNFIFSLQLGILHWKRSSLHKQKRKIHAQKYVNFALKFGTFQDFPNMLTKCCLSHDVSFNFASLQKMKIPTNLMNFNQYLWI